jgi:hypothetical protein
MSDIKIIDLGQGSYLTAEDALVYVQDGVTKKVRAADVAWGVKTLADLADKAYVDTIVGGAPELLNTLKEIADAIGDDPNFASSISTALNQKLNSADFETQFDSKLTTKTTGNLAEGNNLYFTEQRVLDIINPLIPTVFVTSYNDLRDKPVLFSGSYTDLTSKPTIPTDINQLTDSSHLLGQGGGSYPSAPTFTTVTVNQLNVKNVDFTGTGAVTIKSGNDLNFVSAGDIIFDGHQLVGKTAKITKNLLLGSSTNIGTGEPILGIHLTPPASGGFPQSNYNYGPSIEWSGGENKFGKWRNYHNAEEWSWALTYNTAVDAHSVFPATFSKRDSNAPNASIVFANRIDVAEGHSGQNFWSSEWAPAKEDGSPPDWPAGSAMRHYDGGLLSLVNSWGNSAQWAQPGDPQYQPSGTFKDAAIEFVSGYTVANTGKGYTHVVRTSATDGSFKIQDASAFRNSSLWIPITPPVATGIHDVMVINKEPTYDVSFKGPVRSRVFRYSAGNGSINTPVGVEILAIDCQTTSLQIVLPPNAKDGQKFTVTTWYNITGLTWFTTGYNVGTMPSSITPDAPLRLVYIADTSSWFKI